MPRVPTYDNFQVAPSPMPGARVQGTTPTTDAGAPLSQMGQALGQASGVAYQQAMQMQAEANQLRVDDALNKLKEAQLTFTHDRDVGYTNLRGIQALERPDGKPLADEYTGMLRERAEKIAAGLGNDLQRKAFAQRANDVVASFNGGVMRHEADQFREYALSVRDGTIKTRMNEVGLNYRDPNAVSGAIQGIQAAVADIGRLQGKSAEWVQAQTRNMTSNAHKVALSSALQAGDVQYADAYMRRYADQMEADDLLHAKGVITQEMRTRNAFSVASNVMQLMAPRMNTPEGDRAFNIALQAESGGQQFNADGSVKVSKAGAVGVAQVMPETGPEAAKLAGLKWDEKRYQTDPEYNRALGRAYFGEMLKQNGGDLAKAYAAYNAGPGRLKEGVQAAEKDGTHWLTKMPKETQDYVTKNLQAYAAGGGQYQRPTLQDVHNEVRTRVGTADPHLLRMSLDEATRQYEEFTRATKQREDEATAQAMRELVQNGGRFNALSVTTRAALPPKEIDNLLSFGQRIAKGQDITSPALYYKLTSSPEFLRSMSDAEFYRLRSELSEADFKHFTGERAALINGPKGDPRELNTQAINTVLGNRMRTLGVDPTPKDGSSEAMQVGAVQKVVRDSITNAQLQAGKKFTDAEVERHIDQMFEKSVAFRNTFLGFSIGAQKSQRVLTMKLSDIPGDIRDKIKADFKARGVSDPTDGDILGAYMHLQTKTR